MNRICGALAALAIGCGQSAGAVPLDEGGADASPGGDGSNVDAGDAAIAGLFAPASPSTYLVGQWPVAIVAGDFDADGKIDLAVSSIAAAPNGLAVLMGNGDGTFKPAASFPTGEGPASLAVADLDGDGRLDLVSADFGGTVSGLSRQGERHLSHPRELSGERLQLGSGGRLQR